MSKPIIKLENVVRKFQMGEVEVYALRGATLEIYPGEFVIIQGASGSGKTTLLNQIGGIDKPTEGTVIVDGDDITKYNDDQMTRHRRSKIGWIFQFHNLIPSLTALENVQLALEMMEDHENQVEKSKKALESVGLGDMIDRFPSQLSGGQQQRVAIARALVKRPSIIVGDEVTGNLDSKTGHMIINLMVDICKSEGITFVVVTHDSSIASVADRVFYMEDGVIVKETVGGN